MTDQLRNLAEGYTAAWCSQNPASVAAGFAGLPAGLDDAGPCSVPMLRRWIRTDEARDGRGGDLSGGLNVGVGHGSRGNGYVSTAKANRTLRIISPKKAWLVPMWMVGW
jgi:hypothetical protein